MLGMLGYGLMFVVDVAMAGHLGETALAASALASNLNYIPYVFGIGVVGAIAVYQSQDNGAGVEESSPAILRHGMVLALALGVVTAALTHASAQFLPLLGSSPEVTAETHDFFVIMAWAMVPGLAFHALRGHRDSQHQPWISLAWLAAGILANIFFNWLWMFGHWGFPSMGLAGAGWATLVSRILMLVGLWYTPGRGEVRWADGLQLAVFRRLLTTGWPAGLHSLSEVGIFAVVPVMAGSLLSPAARRARRRRAGSDSARATQASARASARASSSSWAGEVVMGMEGQAEMPRRWRASRMARRIHLERSVSSAVTMWSMASIIGTGKRVRTALAVVLLTAPFGGDWRWGCSFGINWVYAEYIERATKFFLLFQGGGNKDAPDSDAPILCRPPDQMDKSKSSWE